MRGRFLALINSNQAGLIIIILVLGGLLTVFGGHHLDAQSGKTVSNFFNANTLLLIATDAGFFAIMAVGATTVIISGGIDLSVGSVYALAGIATAIGLRAMSAHGATGSTLILAGVGICLGVGLLCGLLNGIAITALGVHPFIITLGTMWAFRGLAFVASKAESILLPTPVIDMAKASLGFGKGLHPVPMIAMLIVTVLGSIYLVKTAAGRRVFAVGGNSEASRYSGLKIDKILIGVYTLAGLCAGVAAFLGNSYYGSASCGDATGYELYVIAASVVGGASLSGGKGSALGAMLGALLIVMIRQAIRTIGVDTNYEQIVIGTAIVVAVVLDRMGAKLQAKRQLKARVS